MLSLVHAMNWPAAAVLVVLLVCFTIVACFFRGKQLEEARRDAVDHERANAARQLPKPRLPLSDDEER